MAANRRVGLRRSSHITASLRSTAPNPEFVSSASHLIIWLKPSALRMVPAMLCRYVGCELNRQGATRGASACAARGRQGYFSYLIGVNRSDKDNAFLQLRVILATVLCPAPQSYNH